MNTPTVYISAALLEVEYAAAIRDELAKLGIPCTSTWIDQAMKLQAVIDPTNEGERVEILAQNIGDIQRATACVLLANVGTPRAGLFDAAFAMSIGKKTFWCHDGMKGRNIWDADVLVHRVTAGLNVKQTAVRIENAIRRELGGTKTRVA